MLDNENLSQNSSKGIQRKIADDRRRAELETAVIQAVGWIENIGDIPDADLWRLLEAHTPQRHPQ